MIIVVSCAVFFSVFMWNNDKNTKRIVYPLICTIPLIPVNKGDEAFILFNKTHLTHYPDNGLLIPNRVSHQIDECTISRTEQDTNLGKQSKEIPLSSHMEDLIPIDSQATNDDDMVV